MVFGLNKRSRKPSPKRSNSSTSIVEETLKVSSRMSAEKSVGRRPKQTATGQKASHKKIKKLQTKAQVERLRQILPADYVRIMDGDYAEMSCVTPNLFITGAFGLTKENFEKHKITNIINTSYECPDLQLTGISYTRVLVDDDSDEDLTPHFDKIANNIEKETKKNGNTVVHCVAGVSRSAAFVIAYLIKYKNKSLRDAYVMIRKARKVVKPNKAFFEQLIRYEKRVRGTNSVKMVELKRQGMTITVPDIWNDYPELIAEEIWCAKNPDKIGSSNGVPATAAGMLAAQKQK